MKLGFLMIIMGLGGLGCSEEDPLCVGQPLTSPTESLDFGDLELSEAEPEFDDGMTVPQRAFVFVKNTCPSTIQLTRYCIIQRGHNGDPETMAFEAEEPDRVTLGPGQDSAIRVYFDVATPNRDLDGNGLPDKDSAAMVIETDAEESVPMVIPICARALSQAASQDSISDCTIPEGFPSAAELIEQCAD